MSRLIQRCRKPLQRLSLIVFATMQIASFHSLNADETTGNPALTGYRNFSAIQTELSTLAESKLADLTSLGKTLQGRDIWQLTISSDPTKAKPALLVVGNVEASHVVGAELALRVAKQLIEKGVSDDKFRAFLDAFTVYVIPSPTPDATEKNFSSALREFDGNSVRTDDDRDFEIGEDPPMDLNGDGLITMLRIEDELGTHRVHPDDARIMIPIDAKKNERATHRMMMEAKDVEGDKKFGEDAADGVDFNKNFTFNYNYFGTGAGQNQVSEMESRVMVDFCFDHPNIACVFSFSNQDNLFQPWKTSGSGDSQRIKASLLSLDAPYTDFLASKFKELHGGKEPPASTSSQGAFADWAYYHYGRWSFASRGWWIPTIKVEPKKDKQEKAVEITTADPKSAEAPSAEKSETNPAKAKPDPIANESAAGDKKPSVEKRGQEEINALRWFESVGVNGFVDWKSIDHPDFPGRKVEVGGFKPFVRTQPPVGLIDSVVGPHTDFLVSLADYLPKIEIRDVLVKKLSSGFYEIECELVNKGYMPTMSEMGRTNNESYPIVVEADFPEGTRLIKGERKTLVSKLDGQGGKRALKWLVRIPTNNPEGIKVPLRAASPTMPAVSILLELKP